MHRRSSPLDAKLDRRVPTNPKYANVSSRLDTGKTINKVKYMSANAYLKRQDEVFFRISATQLAELMAKGWAYRPEDRCTSVEMVAELESRLGMRSGLGV